MILGTKLEEKWKSPSISKKHSKIRFFFSLYAMSTLNVDCTFVRISHAPMCTFLLELTNVLSPMLRFEKMKNNY